MQFLTQSQHIPILIFLEPIMKNKPFLIKSICPKILSLCFVMLFTVQSSYSNNINTSSNFPRFTRTVAAITAEAMITPEITSTGKYALNRTVALFNNANLASLTPGAGTLSPVFNANVTDYAVLLPAGTNNFSFTPTLSDGTASIKINGTAHASGTAFTNNIAGISKTFTIQVTSADNTVLKEYTLTVVVSKADDALAVVGQTVTEDAGYVRFIVTGKSAQKVSLELADITANGLSVDYGALKTATVLGTANLEASIDLGQTWTVFNNFVSIPATKLLWVRTPLKNDALIESQEKFKLIVSPVDDALTGMEVYDIGYNSVNLNFPATTLSGTAKTVGAVYSQTNAVTIGGQLLDARMQITNISSVPSSSFIVDNNGTNSSRFQSEIDASSSSGSFVEYELKFYKSGTSTQVGVKNFFVTGVDVDGREYIELNNFSSYQVGSGSLLTISNPRAGFTRYTGASGSLGGIDFEETASFILNYTNPIASLVFRKGNTADPGNARLFSIAFGNSVGNFISSISTESTSSVSAEGIITDAPTQLTITAPQLTKIKDYSGTNTALVVPGTITGIKSGDVVTLTATASYETDAAGTGKKITVVYKLAGADAADYLAPVNFVVNDGVINPLKITVTPTSGLTKVYGSADPTLTYTPTGALSPEVAAFTGSLTRVVNDNVGKYKILVGTLALANNGAFKTSNYTLNFVENVEMTITKATLTVIVKDDSKFESTADVTGFAGITYAGFVYGETKTVITETGLLISRSNSTVQAPGVYNDVLIASGLSSNNYSFNYVPGDFTIFAANQLLVNNILVNEATGKAYFVLSGTAAQQLTLSLADGTSTNKALSTEDYTNAIEYYDGLTWVTYTPGATLSLDANGKLQVRLPIINDTKTEGAEIFSLIATNTTSTNFIGTCTIMDDGTGIIFKNDGTENLDALKDDDRLLTVNNISVNEKSPHAVFVVNGIANQFVKLSLKDVTATAADYGYSIETYTGITWIPYVDNSYIRLDANGNKYVRTIIKTDNVYEGSEIFNLLATNTGGIPADGTGTIKDDGTGDYWFNNSTYPAIKQDLIDNNIKLDDDRIKLYVDKNVTEVNTLVMGNVSTNDVITIGTTYSTPVADAANPAGATLSMKSDGTYTFIAPLPGVYYYDVPVCGPGQTANCELVTLQITVIDPSKNNNPAVINPDIAATSVNKQVIIKVLDNDKSGNTGGKLVISTLSIVVNPQNGLVTINPDGTITYLPNHAFFGKDTFTYSICDDTVPASCRTAEVFITVIRGDVPELTLAADDYALMQGSLNGQGTVSGNVLLNDLNTNSLAKLSATLVTDPTTLPGKLVFNANGTYTFTPNAGFYGPTEAVYTVCDDVIPPSCANATLYILVLNPDTDGDGVSNEQELLDGTNPNSPCDYKTASQDLTKVSAVWKNNDCDNDGLTYNEELTGVDDPNTPANPKGIKTDPRNPDSDGDGVSDAQEALDGTNSNDPCDYKTASQDLTKVSAVWKNNDCDKDGLTYNEELTGVDDPNTPANPKGIKTDPRNPDSDGDGVSDAQEALDGTNSNDPCDYKTASQDLTKVSAAWKTNDCDKDGLTYNEELTGVDDPNTPANPKGIKTDPANPDSDGDGVSDAQEALDGTNPNDPCDYKTASQDLTKVSAVWKANDCDKDGLTNNEELTGIDDPNTPANPKGIKTDLKNLDSDGDGVSDAQEALDGTNPNDPCDYKTASQDLTKVSPAWKANDCDKDGLTNNEELTGVDDPNTPANPKGIKTDPRNPDSDGDGVSDAQEALDGTNPNDPCDYKTASQDLTKVSAAWKANDCDKDGLTNNEELTGVDDSNTPANPKGIKTDPRNPDSDGDGVSDGQEALDGTNPNDPCSFKVLSQTLIPSASWNNGDCDGDGVTNGKEKADGTSPLNNCDLKISSRTLAPNDAWKNQDCDGDGLKNEVDGIDDCDNDGIPNFQDFDICKIDIVMANVFTPNGDGINDEIKPILLGIDKFICFKVFNRWGNKVFETTERDKGWDGTYKESNQGIETFPWLAEGYDRDGNLIKRTGMVTLLR
jgi:gliding motility-associated-like protein